VSHVPGSVVYATFTHITFIQEPEAIPVAASKSIIKERVKGEGAVSILL
jgi:hypothetical protein